MRWKALAATILVWGGSLGTASAGDAVFATPLPHGPGTYVPDGGPLAAPVITPAGTKHGEQIFEFIPAGCEHERFYTNHPGRYLSKDCKDPVQCSSDCLGWVSLEYLYWATQETTVPPLVTTGPASAGPGIAATLGGPGTSRVFGGPHLLDGLRSGFRVEAGLWKDDTGRRALSARFFFLGSDSTQFAGVGGFGNVLNVPQFAAPGVQVPVYVGFPGLAGGTVAASAQTNFLGADATLRQALKAGDCYRCDFLVGYRYLHLGDRVESFFDSISAAGTAGGLRLMGEDSVRTRNNFHGADFGLGGTARWNRFTLEMRSTVALGVTAADLDHSRTRSIGVTGIGGLPVSTAVPFLRAAGREETSYFAVVPQFGVKVGWHPVDHVRLTVGYDYLYWSRVRRAAEQYNLSAVPRHDTGDFWAQGLGLGLELRY